MSSPQRAEPAPGLKVLLVEDDPAQARLVRDLLSEGASTPVKLTHADRMRDAVEHLRKDRFNAVLLDLNLPDSEGMETFTRARAAAPNASIIVLTSVSDEELAIAAVREGAQDYLVKGRVDGPLLYHSIRFAVERRRMQEELREREERFRQLTENMREVFFLVDASLSEALYVNPAYEAVWGRSRSSLGKGSDALLAGVAPSDRDSVLAAFERVRERGHPEEIEFAVLRPDGDTRHILGRMAPIFDRQGAVYRIAAASLDITSRKMAEEAVRASERRLRALFEAVKLIVLALDEEGRISYANPFLAETTGYPVEELVGRSWFDLLPPQQRKPAGSLFWGIMAGEPPRHRRGAILTRGGKVRQISWHNTAVRDADGRATGTLSIGEDVTEHARMEEQFRQAQKMEAVARLAGGIAHDFNNMLAVVLLSTDAAKKAREDTPEVVVEALSEIRLAAEQAAALTRQLLAFSRRQVVDLRPMDPASTIRAMERLLSRLLGEDIDLAIEAPRGLGTILADPTQLEQIVMNLAVNSRDAMPDGGRLSLGLTHMELESEYVASHGILPPGPYLVLTVSDTGAGMDAETLERIFEPFFTTKEQGRGTGLGLATVFGIVKQSGGYISMESEPGVGTTFALYFPEVAGDPVPRLEAVPAPLLRGLVETILLVEDQEGLRTAAQRALESSGYTVLTASDAESALETADRHHGPIDLIVSDVVLPGTGGGALVEELLRRRPGTRVLFTSGYNPDEVLRRGITPTKIPFLPKPFGLAELVRKVDEILGAPDEG